MNLSTRPVPASSRWPGLPVWLLAFAAMYSLDGQVDLANQALLLIVASAIAALWWPAHWSMLACFAAVLVFNFSFVPPRGTLHVDLRQHALLLLTMLSVSWIVILLVARQRQLAEREMQHALLAEQLRQFAEALREADEMPAQAQLLCSALQQLSGGSATVLMLPGSASAAGEGANSLVLGTATADQRCGLELCARQCQALGPGSGRYEEQPAWYLPLRGKTSHPGAAMLPLPMQAHALLPLREHAQALCDQVGLAVERSAALTLASSAREAAQLQEVRNTLLTAIAHDHRTPLATILGAASALHDQADRLSVEQVRRLAASMVEQTTQLSRLTENMLQLARLGSASPTLNRDWESVEELVGSVLRRLRLRGEQHRLDVQLDPGLPLLRCDALLLVQLLENLLDNAIKYAGDSEAIELQASQEGDEVRIAVRDRGRGVPSDQRQRIFQTFQRGDPAVPGDSQAAAGRRGAGVGLAVSLAIARAHGGDLVYRPRLGGGSSFELSLKVEPPPALLQTADGGPGR